MVFLKDIAYEARKVANVTNYGLLCATSRRVHVGTSFERRKEIDCKREGTMDKVLWKRDGLKIDRLVGGRHVDMVESSIKICKDVWYMFCVKAIALMPTLVLIHVQVRGNHKKR